MQGSCVTELTRTVKSLLLKSHDTPVYRMHYIYSDFLTAHMSTTTFSVWSLFVCPYLFMTIDHATKNNGSQLSTNFQCLWSVYRSHVIHCHMTHLNDQMIAR